MQKRNQLKDNREREASSQNTKEKKMKGEEQCQCVGLDPYSRAINILSVLAEIWEREHNQRIQSLVIERKEGDI